MTVRNSLSIISPRQLFTAPNYTSFIRRVKYLPPPLSPPAPAPAPAALVLSHQTPPRRPRFVYD
ncbi:hypothetical protein E2C01_089988 [Portunus trituberculatus]|uniref:Uncharacterized protein n=1 Tax=Portunus trituberculatus TaxID=210409 RepID=A0A5B7JF10_PORTR|nr:hypothetical protein [Portunus trituberculatus]